MVQLDFECRLVQLREKRVACFHTLSYPCLSAICKYVVLIKINVTITAAALFRLLVDIKTQVFNS